jgi:hypothetical protein
MSVAEHEEEEPSDDLLWCATHEISYWHEDGCGFCKEEAADRRDDEH